MRVLNISRCRCCNWRKTTFRMLWTSDWEALEHTNLSPTRVLKRDYAPYHDMKRGERRQVMSSWLSRTCQTCSRSHFWSTRMYATTKSVADYPTVHVCNAHFVDSRSHTKSSHKIKPGNRPKRSFVCGRSRCWSPNYPQNARLPSYKKNKYIRQFIASLRHYGNSDDDAEADSNAMENIFMHFIDIKQRKRWNSDRRERKYFQWLRKFF